MSETPEVQLLTDIIYFARSLGEMEHIVEALKDYKGRIPEPKFSNDLRRAEDLRSSFEKKLGACKAELVTLLAGRGPAAAGEVGTAETARTAGNSS